MFFKTFSRLKNIIKFRDAASFSYSQSGEDIIIKRTLSRMNCPIPVYLDIGANDPVKLNNTYLLYKSGGKGVVVEPNPHYIRQYKKKRPSDHLITAGISSHGGSNLTFYLLSNQALSTFDRDLVQKLVESAGINIVEEMEIPIIGINELLENNFTEASPNFVSLDIEGWDADVLGSFDFNSFRPELFCVETISNRLGGVRQEKDTSIFRVMEENGYIPFADTYINTIFVDEEKWVKR